jgi:hypothetical protein
MSWVYITHGLSQACCAGGKPAATELVLLWRQRENDVTTRCAQPHREVHSRDRKPGLRQPGRHQPGTDRLGATGFQHWLACKPETNIPEHIEQGKSKASLLILVGITDAEMRWR